MDDLDLFVQRKEYYKSVRRKGLEKRLMNVKHDSGFRKLLLATSNRSILVIEDIDRHTKPVPPERHPRDV
ncbi:hypothetical protein AgCh_006381 [Apium graveolens]